MRLWVNRYTQSLTPWRANSTIHYKYGGQAEVPAAYWDVLVGSYTKSRPEISRGDDWVRGRGGLDERERRTG